MLLWEIRIVFFAPTGQIALDYGLIQLVDLAVLIDIRSIHDHDLGFITLPTGQITLDYCLVLPSLLTSPTLYWGWVMVTLTAEPGTASPS